MKISIVTPVVLQNEAMLAMTREAVEHMKTGHKATLYVVCNRLHVCLPEELQKQLEERFCGPVEVVHQPGVERSVAGAWNVGCLRALDAGADYVAIVANDTKLTSDCLDLLVDDGESGEADLWSAISYNNRGTIDPTQRTDGADFSCFMLRRKTLDRHGFFDPNFRPAYFEDNDYYARVVLGGGECRVVHAAQFFHHGSMTVKADPEMAHHVSYWFERNREYFRTKWGVSAPENSKDGVVRRYYRPPSTTARSRYRGFRRMEGRLSGCAVLYVEVARRRKLWMKSQEHQGQSLQRFSGYELEGQRAFRGLGLGELHIACGRA